MDDEVCEHPRDDLTLLLLVEGGVGPLGRVVADGVRHREPLLGPPAARRVALRALARDRGVEAEVRADGLDRPVRAEGDAHAVRLERVPTVGPEHAVLAKSVLRPTLVRDGVRGLHRGDDAEVSEAREVQGRDDLRVLDAVARFVARLRLTEHKLGICARLVYFSRRPEAVERHAVRAVADAVESDLKPGGVALDDHLRQLLGRHARDAAVVRVVGEGREHGRRARAERPVHVALERGQAEAQRVVPVRLELGALALQLLDRALELLPLGDAHGELPLREQFAVERRRVEARHVVGRDGGEPVAARLRERAVERIHHLRARRLRDDAHDEAAGRLLQNPGRLALRVVEDFAALRVARRARDVPLLQGERVGPTDVPVNALEDDGIVGRDFVKVSLRRPRAAPERVIPAAPRDPHARGQLAHARRHARLRLCQRLRADEVHAQQA